MKKKNHEIDPVELMTVVAEERTDESKREKDEDLSADWEKLASARSSLKARPDAAQQIFTLAVNSLDRLIDSLKEGKVLPLTAAEISDLALILSFDFSYSFDFYQWNGKSTDPNDDDTFDTQDAFDWHEHFSDQETVAATLRTYIIASAAKAKEVASDSYSIWRDALAWLNFTELSDYEEKDVKAKLMQLADAAKMLWADLKIANYQPRS